MLNPAQFLDKYNEIGEKKAATGPKKLLLAAILAGFIIGIASAVTMAASYSVEASSLAKLISGVLFPLGLIMVLMTGADLFTGNCLLLIPVHARRIRASRMARNFVLVYLGNFAGAILLAGAMRIFSGPHMADKLLVKIISTAATKCSYSFTEALGLGILCNILVCMAVMMGLCAEDATGRAVGIFAPICCFIICGFEHCVANMYYIPAGLLTLTLPNAGAAVAAAGLDISALTWGNFLVGNLLPVTIGNLLGGFAFAQLLWSANHKQSA